MLWCTLLTITMIWSGAIIWAAWRARWIVSALAALSIVTGVILLAQWAGGAQPIGYGIALGLSIFLTGAMLMLGVIAGTVTWLARREREN